MRRCHFVSHSTSPSTRCLDRSFLLFCPSAVPFSLIPFLLMAAMTRNLIVATSVLGFAFVIVHAAPIPSIFLPRSVGLLCLPASWDTIVLFYVFNYIAHAATVTSSPGDTWRTSFAKTVLALLFPFSGIWSACIVISRSQHWGEARLDHALRAQALCAVVRTHEWRPQPGTTVCGCHTSGICSGAEN